MASVDRMLCGVSARWSGKNHDERTHGEFVRFTNSRVVDGSDGDREGQQIPGQSAFEGGIKPGASPGG